ncbi:MAG: fasciclin domain-containing protein [Prolixibacteraceae bacterium]
MKNKILRKGLFGLLIWGSLSLLLVRCVEPEIPLKELDELQIMEFVEADSTKSYSEFDTIAKKIGMAGILSTRGPFTLFLPDNAAFQEYYKSKGKSSFNDFTDDELTAIIRNHVVAAEISSNNIGLGSLNEKNALGDYLVSEFAGSDIIINKHSIIIDRDIVVANGIIHQVDKVIDPVTKGTYSSIIELEMFSIFARGLELSGLNDTLDIAEIPYGLGTARVRYTILAVPDSVFNANGIFSVEDLVARYDNGKGNLNEVDNGFYEYMVYHCLDKTNYMSTIETGIIDVISHNNYVYFEVADEFTINTDEGDSIVTMFIEKYSNNPTRNGVIHGIDQLLPVKPAKARTYVFDTTSFPELEGLESTYRVDGAVRNFYDGENGFAKIKWTGDYMQYWCKYQGTGFINEDCLVMPQGFWTIEITLPRITRGRYMVTGYFKKGGNRANVVFYFDGVRVDKVVELNGNDGPFVSPEICEVNWTKTEEHVVKVVTVYPGTIMWDRLTFEPIE